MGISVSWYRNSVAQPQNWKEIGIARHYKELPVCTAAAWLRSNGRFRVGGFMRDKITRVIKGPWSHQVTEKLLVYSSAKKSHKIDVYCSVS